MAVRKSSKSSKKTTKTFEKSNDTFLSQPASTENLTPKKNFIKSKIFIILVVLGIAALLYLGKGLFVAALVNGQPISRVEVVGELEKQQGKQALDALVTKALIMQEARKKNIQVSEKEIDDAYKEIENSIKQEGQNLDQALAQQRISKEEFREQLKLRVFVEKLLANDIKVTDKEVEDYVEQNKSTFPEDLKEEDIKKGVRQQLEQQKLQTKSQELITNLQKNAKIQYLVNY